VTPAIVLTVAAPSRQASPEIQERKNRLYADGIRRHGGEPILLDATARAAEREAAFIAMDGLLLSGGADLDPARYGRTVEGSTGMEPDRDELEAAAFDVASARSLPVFGICRGFQAINVFMGGTLLQHVSGHQGAGYGSGPAARHALRLASESHLARVLGAGDPGPVNSYHHQAIRQRDLAPGLMPTAWADSPAGELVEAFEASDGRFLVGVQCHPERTESTPEAFERLWTAFVEACRAGVATR
jgi:gamma-glutamyl-gamma-aminobutyrate hydrolase PuuD